MARKKAKPQAPEAQTEGPAWCPSWPKSLTGWFVLFDGQQGQVLGELAQSEHLIIMLDGSPEARIVSVRHLTESLARFFPPNEEERWRAAAAKMLDDATPDAAERGQ